jgi:hypothetical protein
MKRTLFHVVCGFLVATALAGAQRRSPYTWYNDIHSLPCVNWKPVSTFFGKDGFDIKAFQYHAPEHVWVYGFLAGAGWAPPPQRILGNPVPRVNVDLIDEWMEGYCRRHPNNPIQDGAEALVRELASPR